MNMYKMNSPGTLYFVLISRRIPIVSSDILESITTIGDREISFSCFKIYLPRKIIL